MMASMAGNIGECLGAGRALGGERELPAGCGLCVALIVCVGVVLVKKMGAEKNDWHGVGAYYFLSLTLVVFCRWH